jgi:thiamine-monophosphate kinase
MSRLDEREIVRIFAKKLGIGDLDDVAALSPGGKIVFKSDMLVARTDVPPGMEMWQIARKSIVSCVSDMAAKGALPWAAMISLGIPRKHNRAYIEGLADGFAKASMEFRVRIVGGDTNEAGDLVIDCSMVGVAGSKMPTRAGARPGDAVVVSGLFGLPPAGLAILMKNAQAGAPFKKKAVDSVLMPKPRQRFGIELAKYFSSSIDSSDGLAISLYEIAGQSKVDIDVVEMPIAAGVEKFASQNNLDARQLVFHGGEEYEIVATIAKTKLGKARAAAAKSGLDLLVIGAVKKGRGRVYAGGKLLENKGYVHFKK